MNLKIKIIDSEVSVKLFQTVWSEVMTQNTFTKVVHYEHCCKAGFL